MLSNESPQSFHSSFLVAKKGAVRRQEEAVLSAASTSLYKAARATSSENSNAEHLILSNRPLCPPPVAPTSSSDSLIGAANKRKSGVLNKRTVERLLFDDNGRGSIRVSFPAQEVQS
jgi:hypothetical protein